MGLTSLMALMKTSVAEQSPITAIDIALEPDATMVQRALARMRVCSKPIRAASPWTQRTTRISRCCSSSS